MQRRFKAARLHAQMIAGVVACVIAPDKAWSQCEASELAKLTASDAAASDLFGWSVSVSGHVAVIGSRDDDDAGYASGSAYVYRLDGAHWVEQAKLTASDGRSGDRFGWSVSMSGDMALIGARYDDHVAADAGSAYVFRFDGTQWIEEAKLTASDAANDDAFGWSVAISGEVAVIGAGLDDDKGTSSGSAYVFRFDGTHWIEEVKLTAFDGAASDLFGYSVFVSGDVAMVGAIGDDDAGLSSGSTYVYRFDGTHWIEEVKLTASDAAGGDGFGWSVSLGHEVAVIGAALDDDNGTSSGSAYVFRFDGTHWIEEVKLTASDAAGGDGFGRSVSLWRDVAVIGAWGDNGDRGSAYVYQFDGTNWIEEAKLTASDAASDNRFGRSVSISGDLAVIGAHKDNDAGTDSGSAYVFGGLSDCNDNGGLDICDIADGTSKDDNGNGIPDECEIQDLVLDLDIKPGSCPNPLNRRSHGMMPLAILGTDDFNAGQIDVSSVMLSRADGVGGSVAPNEGPPGPHSVLADVGTPFDGEPCDCHELEGDGVVDLSMHFPTQEVVEALELDDLPPGTFVELTVTGVLRDKTPFAANDCIRLVPPGDMDGDGAVGAMDLMMLISSWGSCAECIDCPVDLDGDCNVGVADLLILLGNWGYGEGMRGEAWEGGTLRVTR